MTALPEPATLTPAAAGGLIRRIRGRLRPELLAELRRLYRSDTGSLLHRTEIMAGEVRLQDLDAYLASLLPVRAGNGSAKGWDAWRASFGERSRRGHSWVEANANLSFSPENHECVHGPFTLLPVLKLARQLLLPGERLAAIASVTWAEPVRHPLRLTIWDAGARQAPSPPAEKPALHGRLRTSQGRPLDFAGTLLAHCRLVAQADYNAFSRVLVEGQRLTAGAHGSIELELAEAGLAACRLAMGRNPALCAALLLDLVPIAILNWKRGRPMVACGYRDVELPDPPRAAFMQGTRLELRYHEDRSHRSTHSPLWIGRYGFRYLPWQERFAEMTMAEADDHETMLRTLHS